MKVRLLMKCGVADYDGRCVGYDYKTYVVDVPETVFNDPKAPFEIIGGEWLRYNDGDYIVEGIKEK